MIFFSLPVPVILSAGNESADQTLHGCLTRILSFNTQQAKSSDENTWHFPYVLQKK